MSYTLYSSPSSFRTFKILIVAEFNSIHIDVADFDANKIIQMSPTAKAPVLQLPCGRTIFESNAISKYIAKIRRDSGMMGRQGTFQEAALIDQWRDFSANVLELPACIWWYSAIGYIQYSQNAYQKAKTDFTNALNVLEKELTNKQFLVGSVSLADITIISALIYPFMFVCDEEFRENFKCVAQWFNRCIEMKEFRNVIGEISLCRKERKPSLI